MADPKSIVGQRLTQVKDFLTMNKTATTIPWDPDCTIFPTRKELQPIDGAPKEAAWVWGKDDGIGRLNLLTPTRVAAASKEIRSGDIVPVKYLWFAYQRHTVRLTLKAYHSMCQMFQHSVVNHSGTRSKCFERITRMMISIT